ncbi:MAG: hypothetical protein PHE67_00185 [Campylobacterales bacterium]|nr:hypothetical protein [Campylobacterales bacterium]
MEIKISINDSDYALFSAKALELGLEPLDTIEGIITKRLSESGLTCKIIHSSHELESSVEKMFLDFKTKMKKYSIHQSSIAECLKVTQATISRDLKSKKTNTALFKAISENSGALLVCAYLRQNAVELDYSENSVPEIADNFFNTIASYLTLKVKTKISNDLFLKLFRIFCKSDFFKELDFEKLYSDIDLFVETTQKIADTHFIPKLREG